MAGRLSTGTTADNTNWHKIVDPIYQDYGSIGGYARNPGVYRCPADKTRNGNKGDLRVRSVSMNQFVGPVGDPASISGKLPAQITFEVYTKTSDFKHLLPVNAFVFVDERADSINDGFLRLDTGGFATAGNYQDLPAIYHGKTSSFSYADGHAETVPTKNVQWQHQGNYTAFY